MENEKKTLLTFETASQLEGRTRGSTFLTGAIIDPDPKKIDMESEGAYKTRKNRVVIMTCSNTHHHHGAHHHASHHWHRGSARVVMFEVEDKQE